MVLARSILESWQKNIGLQLFSITIYERSIFAILHAPSTDNSINRILDCGLANGHIAEVYSAEFSFFYSDRTIL